MPSKPSLQAWTKTVGPSPSMCSLNLIPGLALATIDASVALRTSKWIAPEIVAVLLRIEPRLVEQPHIGIIAEAAVACLAGNFGNDADFDEAFHELIGRRIGGPNQIANLIHGHNWMLIELFEHTMPIASRIAKVVSDESPMRLAHCQDAPRRLGRLHAHLGDTSQEELQPIFPSALVARGLQEIVVGLPVTLQIVREIKHWLMEHAALAQQERN